MQTRIDNVERNAFTRVCPKCKALMSYTEEGSPADWHGVELARYWCCMCKQIFYDTYMKVE